MDGTLWDASEEVAHSWQEAIQASTNTDKVLTKEDYMRVMGKPMDELIEAADTLIWNDAVEKINAIGTVTINSGDAINAAKAAVSRLSADQLKTFPQELLDKLAEAERIYHLLTEGSGTPVLPVTPSKPKNDKPTTGSSFTDVPAGSWYEEAVNYVHEKGLMNGTSSNAFSPNANTTRGMIVTILARVEGVNTSGALWYAAGQKWAMDNGISDGTNMPGVITREQLARLRKLFLAALDKPQSVRDIVQQKLSLAGQDDAARAARKQPDLQLLLQLLDGLADCRLGYKQVLRRSGDIAHAGDLLKDAVKL